MKTSPIRLYTLGARFVDYLLLFIVIGMVTSFLPCFIDGLTYILLFLALPVFMVPVETIFLHCFGGTPGKALFGLTIRSIEGKKLGWKEAFYRAAFMFPRPGVVQSTPLSMMRRLKALFVGVGCIVLSFFGNTLTQWSVSSAGSIATTEKWVSYESEDGFSVQLPEEPTFQRHDIPIEDKTLTFHALKSHQNKHVHYGVSHIDLPAKWKWAGSSTLLKTALETLVRYSPDTELVGKRFTTHQGYRAIDFVLIQGQEEVRGRVILVGTRLYQLTVSYPKDLVLDFTDNHFMDSFDVKR